MLSGLFSVIVVFLFIVLPFFVFAFVIAVVRPKIGNWYINKVKALNKEDLVVFGGRNIFYAWLIVALFLLPIVLYIIFRPSFFDPSWLCTLLVGAIVALMAFQAIQYIWLYSRTKKPDDDKK